MCARLTDRALRLNDRAPAAPIRLKQCAPETALHCASGRSSLQFATDSGFVIRQIVWRDGKPLLEARNARMRYEPVIADENVEVWGVVRACVRNLQG